MSSTYYDLKHLRSSVENFIESLGYEPVLSEKDNIAFMPDEPLDESCYREAKNSDIYVLIIGGRYGSEVSSERSAHTRDKLFFDRYESITKREYESAIDRNIPAYILIDSSVDAEYQTYLKNKRNLKVKYAHVDSVNVFALIEDIRQKKQNNPIKLFSKYSEIESYLKDQWAGLFRELILRLHTASQIQDIDAKVGELSQTTETLKRYLEEVVTQVSKQKADATEIIKQENERLKKAKQESDFLANGYMRHLHRAHNVSVARLDEALRSSDSYAEFLSAVFPGKRESCSASRRAFSEVNDARSQLDLPEYSDEEFDVVRASYEKQRKLDRFNDLVSNKVPKQATKIYTNISTTKISQEKRVPKGKSSKKAS